MPILSVEDQKRISSYTVRPARASAVANAANGLVSAVGRIDIRSSGATVDIDHSVNIYTLTRPPVPTAAETSAGNTNPVVSNPKIGDIAIVYVMDTAQTTPTPGGVAIYVYNTTVNAATGAVSGAASWKALSMV